MDDRITSIDELREMQKAAAAQGSSVTNYHDWERILLDFEDAGIESTGSYTGDRALYDKIMSRLQEYVEQAQTDNREQQFEQNAPENMSKNDNTQALKATLANGLSSTITSDLMKYYHNLM